MTTQVEDGPPRDGGFVLLRIALYCGIFVLAVFIVMLSPIPRLSQGTRGLIGSLSELAMLMGVVAPLLAIVGAVLTFRARRLIALDLVSFAFGLSSALLPALVIYTWSTCAGPFC